MKRLINTPVNLACWVNSEYLPARHIRYLNALLLKMYNGELKRLIVTMPPRHGKSELISKYFPSWYLLNRGDGKIILSSYESSFAESWCMKAKGVYKQFRSDLVIERNNLWQTSREGCMQSAGVGGAITGKGADVFIIDDPVKNQEEANSLVYRNKVWDWFRSTAYTRLSPNGSIIVVMTRWHYDDLVGRINRELILGDGNREGWVIVNMPAICKDSEDVLGRVEGEALWGYDNDIEGKCYGFNLEALNNIKATIGSYWFSALYQQEPIATEYQIFRTEWWRYYDEAPHCDLVIQVWDTAFKVGEENDYSVCATWGVSSGCCYLLGLWRGKCTFPDLERQVIAQYNIWKPKVVLIEDAASGQDLIPVLRKNTRITIKAVKPMAKELRAHMVSPLIESGRVYLSSNAVWLPDFVNEHAEFPIGRHDDIVDTTSIGLQYLQGIVVDKKSSGINLNMSKHKKDKFIYY